VNNFTNAVTAQLCC